MGATVFFDGRSWWCAVQVVADREVPAVTPDPQSVIGVDLGLMNLAVTSDGEVVDALRPLRKMLKRLRRAERVPPEPARRQRRANARGKPSAGPWIQVPGRCGSSNREPTDGSDTSKGVNLK